MTHDPTIGPSVALCCEQTCETTDRHTSSEIRQERAMTARDEFGGYAWGTGDMVMGRTQYAAAMNELDRLRVERATLTAVEGRMLCITHGEIADELNDGEHCNSHGYSDSPGECSLVPLLIRAAREEGKQ